MCHVACNAHVADGATAVGFRLSFGDLKNSCLGEARLACLLHTKAAGLHGSDAMNAAPPSNRLRLRSTGRSTRARLGILLVLFVLMIIKLEWLRFILTRLSAFHRVKPASWGVATARPPTPKPTAAISVAVALRK